MQPAVKQVAGLNSQLSGKLDKSGGTLTGMLTLVAGSTTVAPLKLQSGTNLTTPVFGAVEFNGTNLFVTNNSATPTRKTVAFTDSSITGNAATATTLQNARTINGQSFNGSANITIPIASVGNVAITTPTNGHVLKYNSFTTTWENMAVDATPTDPGTGGGTGTTVTALSNTFDTSAITPFAVNTGNGQSFATSGGDAIGTYTSGSYATIANIPTATTTPNLTNGHQYKVSVHMTCPTGTGYIEFSLIVYDAPSGGSWTELFRLTSTNSSAANVLVENTFTKGTNPIAMQLMGSTANLTYTLHDITVTDLG